MTPNQLLRHLTGVLNFSFTKNKLEGEAYYKWQCDRLSNSLLINDSDACLPITKQPMGIFKSIDFKPKWIDKGEFVAGSYMSKFIDSTIEANDIDIYFKCEADAVEFLKTNLVVPFIGDHKICMTVHIDGKQVNVIWGIEYTSPEQLLSGFDIRACSIGLDPNTSTLYYVDGAPDDCLAKAINFNPTPRQVSINRLVKYVQKGFSIDKYQRLFFAELVRSDRYSTELELTTGYRGKE